MDRWGRQLASIASIGLAVSTCRLSDTLKPAGVKNVALAYGGDSTLVQGLVVAAPAVATVDGEPYAQARFVFTSSDTTVVAVRGDSLEALKRGTATLTVILTSAILPQRPPSITRTLRVVAGSLVLDSAHVTFRSLGDSVTLHATPLDANGKAISGAASWQSSDTAVVAVSAAGKLLALQDGTATVRAIIDFDTAGIPVTVRQVLVHFTFDQPSLLIDAIGGTATATLIARDGRGNAMTGVSPTWSSGDTTVATVNASGTATGVRVGSTFLYARQGVVTDSFPITVTQRATRIVIGPKPVPDVTSINGQRQLNAIAYDTKNVLIPNPPITWSVTDPTILSVSPQGLVTGLAVGTAKVAVALGSGVDSVTVNVTNAPASVRVAPRTASSTTTGDTLLFTAAGFNGRGDTVGGITFSWRSPDTTIVQVTSDGHTILKGVGTARVIAVAGALADTATVTATNVPATVHFVLSGGITSGPVTRTLIAIGDTESPPVVIASARGAALPRGSVTWSSDDPNVVRVTALGLVTARDTGQTLVRMSSGALADSAIYVASNLPASMVVGGLAADTLTALGQSLAYPTEVLNRRGVPIVGYAVAWRSTNRLVVDTVLHDTATAKGYGTTQLIAQAGSLADTVALVVRRLTRWSVDNASVVSPRVGTALRPYARIQDAVNAAGAYDTVIVKVGAGAYSETVALSRQLTLLGDSGSFVAAGRDPAALPLIGHDSGAGGITAYTSAPMTIRYFALRHSLDGPAIDGNGSDLTIEYFYVNPPGSVSSRVGRGISVLNSASGTRIMRSQVNSVRGYGIRLQNANGAVVSGVGVGGVDSLAGLEEGAGIKVVASSTDSIRTNVLRRTQIGVLVSGASGVQVDSNDASTNRVGMRLDGGAVAGVVANDIFDNDSAGVVNPQVANLAIPGNWWGDSLGPRNGGPAVGDSAAGNISYATVLLKPVSVDLVPAVLRLVDGNNQTASRNATLSVPLAVRVVGPGGLPVAGVGVTFAITGGSGRLGGGGLGAPLTVTTNGSGLAKATFRLPNSAGGNIISVTGATASIGGVAFTEFGT